MKHALFLAAILCVAPFACTASDGSPRVLLATLGDSTIALDWTIHGGVDPKQCRRSNATTIDVVVETRDGGSAGEFQQDCEAFATKISLPPGSYVASAVLLDPAGRDRTAHVAIARFTVGADDELHVPIEFPPTSFR